MYYRDNISSYVFFRILLKNLGTVLSLFVVVNLSFASDGMDIVITVNHIQMFNANYNSNKQSELFVLMRIYTCWCAEIKHNMRFLSRNTHL